MGRLEKQIIIGAIALVAVLLGIVVLTGVKPVEGAQEGRTKPEWAAPEVPLSIPGTGGTEQPQGAGEIGLGGSEMSLDAGAEAAALQQPEQPKQPASSAGTQASPPPAPETQPDAGKPLSLDAEDALRRYEVKKGETLGEIAMRELGSYKDLDLLLEVNEGMRADTVRAGDVIWLPHRALADARRASDAQPKAAPAQETPQASSNSGSGRRTHEVGSGDSLWRIAERYYGLDCAQAQAAYYEATYMSYSCQEGTWESADDAPSLDALEAERDKFCQ